MLNFFLKLNTTFNFIWNKCIYYCITDIIILSPLALFIIIVHDNKIYIIEFLVKITINFDELLQFNNYIKILYKPIFFIFIFLIFLHLRSSIPRYKLVDFQNLN